MTMPIRKMILAVVFLLQASTIAAQLRVKEIKVINAATNRPIKNIYCYLLKNNDEWFDFLATNKHGVLKVPLHQLDSNTVYEIAISEDKFKPLLQDIDLYGNGPIIVKLYPDNAFRKKKRSQFYSECSCTWFGHYHPREPHEMHDLPDSIRTKLESHLIDRLGIEFYSRLKIAGGQIIDLERLNAVDNLKNCRWTPASYYICFSFTDISKGIGRYSTTISLDKYGSLVDEIKLPDIKHNPIKGAFISLKQAKTIAKENRCYDKHTRITLEYNKENSSMVWLFERRSSQFNYGAPSWRLEIDAHEGKIIEKHRNERDKELYRDGLDLLPEQVR